MSLVKQGDRIAQLILERIYTPEVVEVNVRMAFIEMTFTAGTLIECNVGGWVQFPRSWMTLSEELVDLDQPVVNRC